MTWPKCRRRRAASRPRGPSCWKCTTTTPALLSQLDGISQVSETDDAHFHRLHSDEGDFFADTVDPHFWNPHSRLSAAVVGRMVQPVIQRRRDLDRLWLPTQHLTAAWPDAEGTGVHVPFDARGLDPGGTTSATRLKLIGREVGSTFELLTRLADGGKACCRRLTRSSCGWRIPTPALWRRPSTAVAPSSPAVAPSPCTRRLSRTCYGATGLWWRLEERRLVFEPTADPAADGGGEDAR